jgi:hypothetical protein
MSDTVITVENLSKSYVIGRKRSKDDGLRHVLQDAAMAVHARRRVEEVFPREGQVQKYLDLYSGLGTRDGGRRLLASSSYFQMEGKSLSRAGRTFSSARCEPFRALEHLFLQAQDAPRV